MNSTALVWLALALSVSFSPTIPAAAHGLSGEATASGDDVEPADEQALIRDLQQALQPTAAGEPRVGIVRCVTPLLARYHAQKDTFSPQTRELVDSYLAPRAIAKTAYISQGGNFELSYTTTGPDAVPLTDLNPINGIPDFVERVAEYCDASWQKQIVELGFTPPALAGGRYRISFAEINAYGYTTIDAGSPGGTRIVVHRDFTGFPPNTDPDGDALGAAKVTIAHEFKHATQYATSLWSEGDWMELDATWVEDVVFDATNDYYNYLYSESPISDPTMSLDAGGGGSYEDCVWQHYLSETYGESFVVDFWSWRSAHAGQSVLASYDALLQARGGSLALDWPVFTAWNFTTGPRAAMGFGYGEASAYPTAPVGGSFSTYPASDTGSLGKLSATFVQCLQLATGPGVVEVSFARTTGSSLELTAVVTTTDGAVVLERIPLAGDVAGGVTLGTPLDQMASLGLSISNSATDGAIKTWTLAVDVIEQLPPAVAAVSPSTVTLSLEAGATGQTSFDVGNIGTAGSVLSYQAVVMQSFPASAATVGKSVQGSTVDALDPTYAAGATIDVVFTVTNASVDEEWLTGVTLSFPAGVTVNASTDFLGGTEGALVSDDATGNGATVRWTDGNGGFGNVYGNGEQATATVSLTFDAALSGDLPIAYIIVGDLWGAAPHSVAGNLTLSPLPNGLDLLAPDGGELLAVGSPVDITWSSTGELANVAIALSRDGGTSWETITTSTPNDGQLAWTVAGPATLSARMKVASLDGSVVDISNSDLMIYDPVRWADVVPASGSIEEGAEAAVTVKVSAAALAQGGHDALIVVFHDGEGSPLTVPLHLTVTAAPTGSPQGAPAPLRLEGNFPNPFNPVTQIRFHLPGEDRVSLQVYNAAGQRVRTVVERVFPAGTHTVAWEGHDDGGRDVASGVYWARLVTTLGTDARSMVLVR